MTCCLAGCGKPATAYPVITLVLEHDRLEVDWVNLGFCEAHAGHELARGENILSVPETRERIERLASRLKPAGGRVLWDKTETVMAPIQ